MTDLRATLEAIPAAYDALGAFLLPGSLPPDPDRRTGPPIASRRAVLNLDVVDLLDTREKADADATRIDYALDRMAGARRQGVLPTLVSWTRLVDGELWDFGIEHEPPADTPTVASECLFLLAHVNWVDDQQWANEIEDDTAAMLRDMRKAVGELERVLHRPCPKCGWNMEPQGDYSAELKRHPWYSCPACSKVLTSASELDAAMKRAEDFVTLKYAAKTLERPYATLRYWKQRGWICPLGKDSRGDIYSLKSIKSIAMSVEARRRYEGGAA